MNSRTALSPRPFAKLAARLATVAIALVAAAALTSCSTDAQAAAPVAGVDYVEIPDGARFGPDDGKIEVVEVFGYWCIHCANFAPQLEAWKQKQGDDVRVTFLPLPRSARDPLATVYFASETMGTLSRTHDATFRAIHEQNLLPKNPTADEIAAFYAGKGVDATKLKAAMAAGSTLERLQAARKFAIDSGIEGTPTVVVNGRYRITANSFEELLRIADALITRERTAAR